MKAYGYTAQWENCWREHDAERFNNLDLATVIVSSENGISDNQQIFDSLDECKSAIEYPYRWLNLIEPFNRDLVWREPRQSEAVLEGVCMTLEEEYEGLIKIHLFVIYEMEMAE